MKKSLIFLTITLFLFSTAAYAGGGRGSGGKGSGVSGSMAGGSSYQKRIKTRSGSRNTYRKNTGEGTLNQFRKQAQTSSKNGDEASNGSGDMIRKRDQKRDESCDDGEE